jgi:3-hydroxyacyl-CoA dehydrogenase / enoyl-CoA hydratase / 3-hydroxybutyryl-CoA epimerase
LVPSSRILSDPQPELPEDAVLTWDADGVATVWLGSHARQPRPYSLERLHHLDACLDQVETGVTDAGVAALVLRIGGPPTELTDLDFEEIRSLRDAKAASVWAGEGQRILQRIEQLPIPAVAAIAGRCSWSGLQIALACHYRLALGSPTTRLGLPEVRLGILPAWGGMVRLMRLVGVRSALDLILRRVSVSTARAESMGLVDDVFSGSRFEERLRRFTLERTRRNDGYPASRRSMATRVLEDTAPGRRLVFAHATRRARKNGRVHGIIVTTVLRTAADILALPLEGALATEADRFAELLADDVSRGLINHRLLLHPASSPTAREAGREVGRTAVIGAGSRGVDLAQALARRRLSVRLKDTRRETVALAIRQLHDRFAREALEKSVDEREMERSVRRISGTTGFGGFGRIDVVIEAVAEHPETARQALRETEDHVRDSCILLTTAPMVSVSEVQRGLQRPEQLAGLHLFRPGCRRGVVEVVRGEQTADATVHTACALARRLARVPVMVADSPGLVTYRLVVPYLNEALRLRNEGFTAEQIDGAIVHFGMSTGPLCLLREIGVGDFERVAAGLATQLGDRFAPGPLLVDSGRRSSAPHKARRLLVGLRLLPGLPSRAARWSSRGDGPVAEADAIHQRLVLTLINEAALVLAQGVVPAASEIDRVAASALGFPAERGGLLFYADRIGAASVVERLETLAARHGSRFAPAPLLRQLAAADGRFYEREILSAEAAAGQVGVKVLT